MADYRAIASVGKSLERFLSACFLEAPVPVEGARTVATLARTEDFRDGGRLTPPCLSIFLYRIDYNKTMRAAWSGVGSLDGMGHLPLDLHYMLTPWAKDPELEHRIIGRALQCLEATPLLSGPLLTAGGDWAPNEGIQVVLEDVPTEWVMRTFDSLPTDFKLSVPYCARVARIDTRRVVGVPDVTTAIAGATPSATPSATASARAEDA